MTHVIEAALSGRAKCRGCDQPIAKDELRLGERAPNAFGEGEMTIWFHPRCGAFKRPEVLLEGLDAAQAGIPASADLRSIAEAGIAHRRLPRVNGAQRSPTGRARCRSCREPIAKDAWRVPLVFFEMGRFQPSGNIHAACALAYLGTVELIDRVRHFSPDLTPEDLEAFSQALRRGAG